MGWSVARVARVAAAVVVLTVAAPAMAAVLVRVAVRALSGPTYLVAMKAVLPEERQLEGGAVPVASSSASLAKSVLL